MGAVLNVCVGGGRITSSSSVTASSRNESLSLSLSLSPSLSSVTVPPTTRRISHILHRNKRYSIPVCNIVQLTCLGSGTVCSAVQHPKHAQVAFKDTSSYVACDNGVYSGVVSSLCVWQCCDHAQVITEPAQHDKHTHVA